jgi:PKD repeat protein
MVLGISICAVGARADTLVTTEHQITAGETVRVYSTMPRLGRDGVSKLVVYTANDVLPNGALGPGSIYYQRLTDDGAPAGSPVRVAPGGPYDNELDDVSGDFIVYIAYDGTTSVSGRVMVYQISTQVTRIAGNATAIQEARIHAGTVVWRQGESGATQVKRFEVAWFGTSHLPVTIAGPIPPAFALDLGGRFAAYSVLEGGQYEVEAFDLGLGQAVSVSALAGFNETDPSTDGAWLTWSEQELGQRLPRIWARNLDTGEVRLVADNGAGCYRPSISGDLITYESNLDGSLGIFAYRLSTSETFQVTANTSDQFLNDVFDDLVAYVDLRNGFGDVHVSHLEFLPPNRPPVANAGPDQVVYTGDQAVLNGTAEDPDGDPITLWTWTIVEAPPGGGFYLGSDDAPTAYFRPFAAGDYVFSLRAGDPYSMSAPDYVTVRAHANLPPVAVITADWTTGIAPLTVCLDGSQSQDPEGDPLAYIWTLSDGYVEYAAATCHELWRPGKYTATLLVTDVRNAVDIESLVIEVLPPANQPPATSPTATPRSGLAPLAVQFAANATDLDGDALTYAWEFGDGGTSDLPNPAHTYVVAGTYAAWLTVSDGEASASASLTIAVSPAIELNVTRADIDFRSRRSQLADVEILAELYAAIPGSDEVVALYLDGALVFAAPFGRFEPVRRHGAVAPGVFKLKEPHLWVQLDLAEGRLAVEAHRVMLSGYDPRNGVDVELMLGGATAVDNVRPVDERGDRHYRHHRPERGRGGCGR